MRFAVSCSLFAVQSAITTKSFSCVWLVCARIKIVLSTYFRAYRWPLIAPASVYERSDNLFIRILTPSALKWCDLWKKNVLKIVRYRSSVWSRTSSAQGVLCGYYYYYTTTKTPRAQLLWIKHPFILRAAIFFLGKLVGPNVVDLVTLPSKRSDRQEGRISRDFLVFRQRWFALNPQTSWYVQCTLFESSTCACVYYQKRVWCTWVVWTKYSSQYIQRGPRTVTLKLLLFWLVSIDFFMINNASDW